MAGPGTPAYPSTGGQNTHLIDEFEASFQNCIKSLTSQEYFNASDSDEVKTGVEQNTQKFLDLARQTESFFLQRRLLVSVIKPEQVVKEDIQDLRQELMKKELILSKHYEKLQQWQALMGTSPSGQAASSQQGTPHPSQPVPQGGQPSIPHPPPHPQQPTQVPGQPMMQQAHPYPGGPGPLAYLEQTMSNIGMPERR